VQFDPQNRFKNVDLGMLLQLATTFWILESTTGKKTLKIMVEKVSKPAKTRVLALFGQFLGPIFQQIIESGHLAYSKVHFDPQNRLKSVDLGMLLQLATTFLILESTTGKKP